MDDYKYAASFAKTISRNHFNTKGFVGLVLRGNASSPFPPSTIHKRLSRGTVSTAKEAKEKAQNYIDKHLA